MITHIGGYKIPDNATHLSIGSRFSDFHSVSFYRQDTDGIVWWKINNDPWVSLGKTKDLEDSRIAEINREEKRMTNYVPHGATHFAQGTNESKTYYIVKGSNVDYWHWGDRKWLSSCKPSYQLTPMPKPGFTKSDLRTGMIVTFRNGEKATVLLNYETVDKQLLKVLRTDDSGWMDLDDYSEDNLEFTTSGDRYGYSIAKVEQPVGGGAYNLKTVFTVIVEETQEEKDYKEALAKLVQANHKVQEAQLLVEKLNPNKGTV